MLPNELPAHFEELRMITKRQLRQMVPYSDQHILRLEKQGKFPRRRDLGDNRVAWLYVEIREWILNRPTRNYLPEDDILGCEDEEGPKRWALFH